jgi:hypothetical protein
MLKGFCFAASFSRGHTLHVFHLCFVPVLFSFIIFLCCYFCKETIISTERRLNRSGACNQSRFCGNRFGNPTTRPVNQGCSIMKDFPLKGGSYWDSQIHFFYHKFGGINMSLVIMTSIFVT